ncbi:Crp/Fnr family transcriptional regulator [Actinomadura luteofluorescens]|uniref:Crp/Fnr family transcriptional regulator n=1 Tax=Actinomadura luteofluorescens TaxID=46163 RepID=UPI003640A5FE
MNEHARHHDPDKIVPTGIVPRQRSLRQAESARRPGFWHGLTTIERAAFLALAREVVHPVGAVLWTEGQDADHTFVIKASSVRISVERDGRERFVAFRGPGDIIGERAALLLRRRSATVVAMDALHVLCLTTQEFVAYLSDHPHVVAVLEREMYDRMTEQVPGRAAAARPPSRRRGAPVRTGGAVRLAAAVRHGAAARGAELPVRDGRAVRGGRPVRRARPAGWRRDLQGRARRRDQRLRRRPDRPVPDRAGQHPAA